MGHFMKTGSRSNGGQKGVKWLLAVSQYKIGSPHMFEFSMDQLIYTYMPSLNRVW